MKILYYITLLLLVTNCIGSKKKDVKTKAIQNVNSAEVDATLLKKMELPEHIENTDFTFHPVSLKDTTETKRFYSFSSGSSNPYRSAHGYSTDTFNGDYINFIIENKDTGVAIELTEENVLITQLSVCRPSNEKNQKTIIAIVNDTDTNKDGILNNLDLRSLYLSNIDGSSFTKCSEKLEHLAHYQYIGETNKLFYYTVIDSNHDGLYNDRDLQTNYYIDLNSPSWISKSYDKTTLLSQQRQTISQE